jgi:hypothetical protein
MNKSFNGIRRSCVPRAINAAPRKLFFHTNNALPCRRSHSVKPGEVVVGPNLANLGTQRKSVEYSDEAAFA